MVLLAGVALVSACGRSKKAGTTEAAELRTLEVSTAAVLSRDVPVFIQATGSFAADEASDLAPETSGQVAATPVDVGAFVKQGAVIARLNDQDARLRLQQALAAERQAAAAVRQAEARLGLGPDGKFDDSTVPEVRAARQTYEAAEAQARLAETNARRYAGLVESGVVSRIVYDQARTEAESARSNANASRQQYEVALNTARLNNQGIATAQAALEGARSQVAIARKAVSDSVITAPFSGYISERPVAVGEYVTPASKIATLLRTSPIKLLLQLPEAQTGRVGPGTPVTAVVAAYPAREFGGRVKVINPALDLTSRTITVEISIDNPGNAIRPGMFATARIVQPSGGQGVFIPHTAALAEPNSTTARVFVIEGDIARVRVVQIGEREADSVRVVSGLTGTEVVATDNLDQLFDGATVRRR